jgi:hypothetical protein
MQQCLEDYQEVTDGVVLLERMMERLVWIDVIPVAASDSLALTVFGTHRPRLVGWSAPEVIGSRQLLSRV